MGTRVPSAAKTAALRGKFQRVKLSRRPRARATAAVLACTTLCGHDAAANGRFPTAQFFALGDGAARDRIAITTTYGLIVSRDGGDQWNWICEDALGFSGEYDPVTAITDSGALIVTLPTGASIARGDWCDFAPIAAAMTDPSIDVTVRGTRVALTQQLATGGAQLLTSDDDGASFRRAWTSSTYFIDTIDYSPINSSLIYATARDRLGYPWILRSEDSGASLAPTTATPLPMTTASFIAAVDGLDDRRVLFRGFFSDGSSFLARSDDGGDSLRTLTTSEGSMVGAAATNGFDTVWSMAAGDGARLRRSDDGGAAFRPLAATIRARSLRFRRGVLYATTSDQQSGYAFGCSQDGGESFRRMLAIDEIRGPEACGETSSVRARCAALWPAVRAQLLAIARPAAPPKARCAEGVWDAATDAGADAATDAADVTDATDDTDATDSSDAARDEGRASDVASRDGAPIDARDASSGDAVRWRASGGCQCSAQPFATARGSAAAGALLSLAWMRRRARGRRPPYQTPRRST